MYLIKLYILKIYKMETAILATLSGLSITTNITQKLLSNSIQTSLDILKLFITSHHEQVNEVLLETDLISNLEIIEALMGDIEKNKEMQEHLAIQKALTNLHLIVEQIQKILEDINQKIKYHHTKYFSSWRTLKYEKQLANLKKSIKLLNIRYQMFLEVIKVIKS